MKSRAALYYQLSERVPGILRKSDIENSSYQGNGQPQHGDCRHKNMGRSQAQLLWDRLTTCPASVSLWFWGRRWCWLTANQHDEDVAVKISDVLLNDPLPLKCKYLVCVASESNRLAFLLPLLDPTRSQPSPYTVQRQKENYGSFSPFFLPPYWAKPWSHSYHSNPGRNSQESVSLDLHGYNWEHNSSPRLRRWLLSREKY